MGSISASAYKRGKNPPAANSYQSRRARYLRAFLSASGMRLGSHWVAIKVLTVAVEFTAAIAMGPSAVEAQFRLV